MCACKTGFLHLYQQNDQLIRNEILSLLVGGAEQVGVIRGVVCFFSLERYFWRWEDTWSLVSPSTFMWFNITDGTEFLPSFSSTTTNLFCICSFQTILLLGVIFSFSAKILGVDWDSFERLAGEKAIQVSFLVICIVSVFTLAWRTKWIMGPKWAFKGPYHPSVVYT